MKLNYLKTIVLLVFSSVSLGSCMSNEKYSATLVEETYVPSVNDYIEQAYLVAENWEPDVYLTNVFVIFGYSNNSQLSFFFESPSHPMVGLIVDISQDEISQEFILVKMNETNKLSQTFWGIDSPDLIEMVLSQKEVIRFIKSTNGKVCGTMDFSNTNKILEKSSLWWINIIDCTDIRRSIKFYIDPENGEIIYS